MATIARRRDRHQSPHDGRLPSVSDANREMKAIRQLLLDGPVADLMQYVACEHVLVKARHIVCAGKKPRRPYLGDRYLRLLGSELGRGDHGFGPVQWRKPYAIQSVPDAVTATAMLLILQSVFEPHRYFRSFGWLTDHGPHEAIEHLCYLLTRNQYFARVDVAHCFESIRHDLVLRQLTPVVSDELFLDLVASYLISVQTAPGTGVGRGSALAPCLADIALSAVDSYFAPDIRLPDHYYMHLPACLPAPLATHRHAQPMIDTHRHNLAEKTPEGRLRRDTTRTKRLRRPSTEARTSSDDDREDRNRNRNRNRLSHNSGTSLPVPDSVRDPVSPVPSFNHLRCCDDFVATGVGDRKRASQVLDTYRAALEAVGLSSATHKEKMGLVSEGFDFLGLHLRLVESDVVVTLSQDRVQNHCNALDNEFWRLLRADARRPQEILRQLQQLTTQKTQYARQAGADCSDISEYVDSEFKRRMTWLRMD